MKAALDHTACATARTAMVAARRAEHQLLLQVADLIARGVTQTSGYRSTRRMLEDLFRVDPARARRLETQAALLAPGTTLTGQPVPPVLPATAQVHADGLLDDAHLRVIAATMNQLARIPGLPPDTFAQAEVTLAQAACVLAPAGLEKVARRLVNTLDPDSAAPDEQPEPLDEVHLVRRRDGRLHGTLVIHGRADAELLTEVFDRLSAPAGPHDPRTLTQRRAEVLLDLAAQAASPTGIATPDHDTTADAGDDPTADGEREDRVDEHDAVAEEHKDNSAFWSAPPEQPARSGQRRPGCPTMPVLGRALLAVTIDHHWLTTALGHGLLDSEHPVDPATTRRLACDAGIIPLVLGSRSEPLDVGRLSYTVPDGLRRALHHRDGGCTFPGCTRRPRRCHAHHLQHWADGGDTSLDNLTLLCRYHHHLIHHDHWSIHMIDGRPWYYPPSWIDPHRQPRPGGRFPLHDAS